MKLFFINSFDTVISETREGDILRASLLFADKIHTVCRLSKLLNLENSLRHSSEKSKISLLQNYVPDLLDDEPELKKDYDIFLTIYKKVKSIKSKSRDELIEIMLLRKYIDACVNLVLAWQKEKACEYNVNDLILLTGTDKEIYIEPIENSEQLTIETVEKYILSEDHCLLFDRIIAKNCRGIPLRKALKIDEKKFTDIKNIILLYEELMPVPLLIDFPQEYYKIIRDNFLKAREEFNNIFLNEKQNIERALFNKANAEIFIKALCSIKDKSSSFGFIENENTLLKEWQTGNGKFKRTRIYAAVTSIEKLILIMERLKIIKERERLYLLNKISGKRNLQSGILFLIAI